MSNNGHTVYFETQGDGPPVILIHGMAASLRQWDYLMPQLVNAGFSAYALDLQGHGNSPKPEGAEHYHIETLFNQLNFWIENLGLDQPVILIGHSFGGYLSLLYALRNPEKVQRLVLADPFYSPFQLSPFVRYFAQQSQIGIRVLEWLPAWVVDMGMYWSEKVQQALPRPVHRQLAVDFKRTTPLFLNITRTAKDLTPQLSQVQHPTLVMWGSEDMTLAPASFPRIVEELPEVKSHIFQGCGHIPHLTQANSFNQFVLDFVTSFE
jgi:pimeloyl-ACP methyl ester carboxylesterase